MTVVRYHFCYVLASILAILAYRPVVANDSDVDIDTIVVTASRIDVEKSETSHSVEIIDRDDIAARQAPNVTELLRQVAGLNVIQQGGRGGVTSVILRGGEPNFTVVLIDGVKVNDPTNTRGGSYDFSYLDIGNVERVEIVRGPMSAIYGSDALAGVINIISRDGSDGSRIAAQIGGHGLKSATAVVGRQNGQWVGSIGGHVHEEDGDIEGSSYEDWGFHGSLNTQLGETGEVGIVLRHLDAKSMGFPEESGGPIYAVIRDVDRRKVQESHARVFASSSFGSKWQGLLSTSRYQRDEDYASPGIAPGVFNGVPPNSAKTKFSRDLLTLVISREFSESLSFVAGGEWQREDGQSIGVLDIGFPLPTDYQLKRDTVSVFSELSVELGQVVLQGSLRWDDPDEIAAETSAQIGAIFNLANELGSVLVNWGQAFKAPSFFALGHPIAGNPNLVSETSASVDVGYRRNLPSLRGMFELTVFHNKYKNLIDFDPILFMSVNRSEVVTQGVEASATLALGAAVQLRGHVTYLDSDIKDSSIPLRGRPHWRAGAIVEWAVNEQWRVVTSLLSLDEFYEVSIPTGGLYLDGYARLDVAVKYQATERLGIGLAVDNLLNSDYQEAVGFPTAGTRVRVNAEYQF